MDRTLLGRVMMALGVVLLVAGVVGLVTGGDDASTAATALESSGTPSSSTSSTTPTSSTPTTTTTTSTTTTTTTTTSTTTTTVPAVEAETPEEFLTVLLDAFAGGDAVTLLARMNRATIDRYGLAQCEAYAASVAGTAQDLVFRETTALATWDYETDAVATTIAGATAVEVERTINSQTLIQELHWQLVDGRFTWFTDCGDPA